MVLKITSWALSMGPVPQLSVPSQSGPLLTLAPILRLNSVQDLNRQVPSSVSDIRRAHDAKGMREEPPCLGCFAFHSVYPTIPHPLPAPQSKSSGMHTSLAKSFTAANTLPNCCFAFSAWLCSCCCVGKCVDATYTQRPHQTRLEQRGTL